MFFAVCCVLCAVCGLQSFVVGDVYFSMVFDNDLAVLSDHCMWVIEGVSGGDG